MAQQTARLSENWLENENILFDLFRLYCIFNDQSSFQCRRVVYKFEIELYPVSVGNSLHFYQACHIQCSFLSLN